MGILQTILIVILAYYALLLLARLLRPWIRAYAARKAESFFRKAYENAAGQEDSGPVGEVTVEKGPSKSRKPSAKVGEYIEFEEIE